MEMSGEQSNLEKLISQTLTTALSGKNDVIRDVISVFLYHELNDVYEYFKDEDIQSIIVTAIKKLNNNNEIPSDASKINNNFKNRLHKEVDNVISEKIDEKLKNLNKNISEKDKRYMKYLNQNINNNNNTAKLHIMTSLVLNSATNEKSNKKISSNLKNKFSSEFKNLALLKDFKKEENIEINTSKVENNSKAKKTFTKESIKAASKEKLSIAKKTTAHFLKKRFTSIKKVISGLRLAVSLRIACGNMPKIKLDTKKIDIILKREKEYVTGNTYFVEKGTLTLEDFNNIISKSRSKLTEQKEFIKDLPDNREKKRFEEYLDEKINEFDKFAADETNNLKEQKNNFTP